MKKEKLVRYCFAFFTCKNQIKILLHLVFDIRYVLNLEYFDHISSLALSFQFLSENQLSMSSAHKIVDDKHLYSDDMQKVR